MSNKDRDFYEEYISRNTTKINDTRYLETSIIKRVKSLNNNNNDNIYGIGYNRIMNIFNIENDFIMQYYSVGYIGVILLLGVYVVILVYLYLKTLFNLEKYFTYENGMLLFITTYYLICSFYTGNILNAISTILPLSFVMGYHLSIMNKKKRRMAIVLSAIIGSLVLALSGCSDQSGQTEKTLRVGVITYSQDDPFINALTDELKAHLKTMESEERRIIVSIKSGNDDQQEQNEKVEEMIDAGCDVLCVNLVDRTAPYRIIRMARNENIPVIFFNREPVKEDLMQWDKLYYVGCDAEQSGIMQGEIAAEYINSHPEVDKNEDGKIQYVLLEGEAGHQDAISRTEYSVKTLMKNDVSLEKLSYQFADWNRGQAENRMNRLISQYGTEIELVLSNNDEMALGAVEAYRKVGYIRKDWPVIFGIDGLEDALEAVKAGEMQGSIYNDRVDQAKEMAKMAVTLFEGKDLDQESLKDGRYYFSEYKKVDGSNIEEYLNAEEEEADGKNMEP